MRRRQKPVLLAAMAAMAVMTVTSVRAQTMANPSETDFRVTATGDLVRLCEAAPTDATGIAALHFCHGFAVGAYQYHQIAAAAENKPPLFCEPNLQAIAQRGHRRLHLLGEAEPRCDEHAAGRRNVPLSGPKLSVPSLTAGFEAKGPMEMDMSLQGTIKRLSCVAAIALSLAACSDMSATQQRALTGTTGGAAGGALIGAIAGNAAMGAAIGAGAGLAGGMLYDYHKKGEESAYQRGLQEGQL